MKKSPKTKNPVGRPTKYCPDIIKEALYYLNNYKKRGDVVPQIAGLALHLGVRRDTLYEWAKDKNKKEFSDIFDRIRASQEGALINGSLLGDFNSAITKMLLTKHGYSDKVDSQIDHTSGGKEISGITRVVIDRKDK